MEQEEADEIMGRPYLALRSLAEQLASIAKARVCRSVVSNLRSLPGMLEDSVLRNVWDEVCVQVQGEHSGCWEDAYVATIEQLVATQVGRLSGVEKQAIWLLSEYGSDWLYPVADHNGDIGQRKAIIPVDDNEVIALVVGSLLQEAANYENARIRAYLDIEPVDDAW